MDIRPYLLSISLIACSSRDAAPDLQITEMRALRVGPADACPTQHLIQLSNRGDAPAYAVLLDVGSATDQAASSVRIHPGPGVGQSVMATVCWPEDLLPPHCVTARLQRLTEGDAKDPDPANNQWCTSS